MTTRYDIEVIHEGQDGRLRSLSSAVSAEVEAVGVHKSVNVVVSDSSPVSQRAATVLLGGVATAAAPRCATAAAAALRAGRTVIPVVDDLDGFVAATPTTVHALNGWTWSGGDAATRLARLLLEELGIEERQRRVFISHKREDGLLMAEQLHDALSHSGFQPFVDRFAIRAGLPVQDVIADALEDFAFLLLVESPLAHTSAWVYDEVEYALSHYMGIHIVTWPGAVPPVAGTPGLRRQVLEAGDLTSDRGYQVVTAAAVDAIVAETEAMHAHGLVRRRTNLLTSVAEAARLAGCSVSVLPNWRLLVESSGKRHLLGVTGRLPTAADLHHLDRDIALHRPDRRVLVHAARAISPERARLLRWIVGRRRIDLVAEHMAGGYW